jgi:acyl-CoA synthetase (AMP-forming)/AMP-acid ligase II
VSDDLGLWELVEARADATPDAVLGVDEAGRTLDAAGFREAAERAAAGLHALGVVADTPVSWMLPTWLESMVLVVALARLGAVQNPMLPILGPREMRFITDQTAARLLVVPGTWRGRDYTADARRLRSEHPALQVLTVDRALPDGDPAALPPPPRATTPADAPARWIFYTSGTTADPKGARHTDHTVKAAAVGMLEALEVQPSDRTAFVFPLTHIGGIVQVYTVLITASRLLFVEAFDPRTTIPWLGDRGVTLAGAGTAFHLAYLAAQRDQPDTPIFPAVRAFPGGAAPKPPQLHYDLKAEAGGIGIVSGWGLTEAPILTMNTVHGTDEQLADTEGPAVRDVELRTVGADGHPTPPGVEGELRAKGPQICRGHVDARLDADVFDADGWFRTGDLGVIRPDGHVVITGRLKDVIIRKGETISAKELEDVLFTHPAIADVAVVGLPDAAAGERACAVLVVAEGATAPTPGDLFQFLTDEGLSTRKVPEQLEVVDRLPRNASGKVLKHELRDRYGAP